MFYDVRLKRAVVADFKLIASLRRQTSHVLKHLFKAYNKSID